MQTAHEQVARLARRQLPLQPTELWVLRIQYVQIRYLHLLIARRRILTQTKKRVKKRAKLLIFFHICKPPRVFYRKCIFLSAKIWRNRENVLSSALSEKGKVYATKFSDKRRFFSAHGQCCIFGLSHKGTLRSYYRVLQGVWKFFGTPLPMWGGTLRKREGICDQIFRQKAFLFCPMGSVVPSAPPLKGPSVATSASCSLYATSHKNTKQG